MFDKVVGLAVERWKGGGWKERDPMINDVCILHD